MVEVMIVTMVMTTLIAISVPAGRSALDSLELSTAREEVGFALRTARLRAVSANRPMRLRLNCQATGQYRVVEVTGVASVDAALNRCDEASFGYPGPKDSNPATPAHDGPLRYLKSHIDELRGPDLEFSPNGTARVVAGGVAQTMTTEAVVEVERDGETLGIRINALGRIEHMQRPPTQ